MHGDVETIMGRGLGHYAREPWLKDGKLDWRATPKESGDRDVLRPASDPFDAEGGIRLLTGNLGRSIIKNHPFVDGNKRTGFESMRLFLRMNGFDLRAGEDQKFDFILKIVSDPETDEHHIAEWLQSHSRKHR